MKQIPNDQFFSWIETEIATGHSVQFRLKGYSMFPLLRNRQDKVILYPCMNEELRPMDVVLFKYNGKYLLHRIIKREGMLLTIQGDGSFTAMEQCSVTDVIGKLQFIVRPSGKILSVNSWQWKLSSLLWRKPAYSEIPFYGSFIIWQDNDINKALFCSNPLSYIILNSTDYKYSIFRNLQISENK